LRRFLIFGENLGRIHHFDFSRYGLASAVPCR
jgi:hypothetical protein